MRERGISTLYCASSHRISSSFWWVMVRYIIPSCLTIVKIDFGWICFVNGGLKQLAWLLTSLTCSLSTFPPFIFLLPTLLVSVLLFVFLLSLSCISSLIHSSSTSTNREAIILENFPGNNLNMNVNVSWKEIVFMKVIRTFYFRRISLRWWASHSTETGRGMYV